MERRAEPLLDEHRLQELRSIAPGAETEFLRSVMDVFLTALPEHRDTLQLFAAGGPADKRELTYAAHTLHGSCSTVGATRLQKMLRRFEDQLEAMDDPASAPELRQDAASIVETADITRHEIEQRLDS